MEIAGYSFRVVKGQILYGGPGIFIYTHLSTGKCFVSAKRNSRAQRSKNNFPNLLKELLKTDKSDVIVWHAELPKDTKEALYIASRAVVSHLSEKGTLYKRPRPNRGGIYRQLTGEEKIRFTIWRMTHKATGATFYFDDVKGTPLEKIEAKISQRMLSFNNYVMKDIVNANRVMHAFIKKTGFTDISHWDYVDMDEEFSTENESALRITKLSRDRLVAGLVVLNRISSVDALYYHNAMLKLSHLSMEEYLAGLK